MNFSSTLGIMLLALILLFGLFYWCRFLFKKLFPNFKYALKYRFFRFKKKQLIVDVMNEFTEQGIEGDKVYSQLLCNGIKPKKAKEMIYIQTLLKGGKK